MGFIRGGLVTILSIVLLVDLLLVNSLLTLTTSLDYENVKQEIANVTENILQEQLEIGNNIDEIFEVMKVQCKTNPDFVLSYEGYTLEVDCADVAEGKQKTINRIIENSVEDIYYKDYDCSFLECLKNSQYPFFLISEKSRNYFENKLYFALLIGLIITTAIFLIMEERLNLPILVGSLIIVSSLPFAKLNTLFSSTDNKYLGLLNIFLGSSHEVFVKMLSAGIAILLIGIVIRLLNWDSIKKKFSKEEVEEIVKEEISKVKKENTTKKNKKEEKKNISKVKKAKTKKS